MPNRTGRAKNKTSSLSLSLSLSSQNELIAFLAFFFFLSFSPVRGVLEKACKLVQSPQYVVSLKKRMTKVAAALSDDGTHF